MSLTLESVLAPILWILEAQRYMIEFFLDSPTASAAAVKWLFLLFPVLLFVAAAWCTQISLYTIPFRPKRIQFAQRMLFAWWDAARAVMLYWVGVVRFAWVAIGWLLALLRLALRLAVDSVKQLVTAPFSMTGRLSRSYFQPGVPWVAFLMLVFWCLLEATIFTYTLFPTVSEVLTDLVGVEAHGMTGPVLFGFLLMLILGSFACIQVLADSFRERRFRFILQMVLVELFVMFFEVMFLYRELIDAITPWIAQQTGERFRMGLELTLALSAFGWIGIRGMTWFLFGQFGTPPLLAFISRTPMAQQLDPAVASIQGAEEARWWRAPLEDFNAEIEWLHGRSEEILEYLTLPLLQVLAAALNFAMILLTANPVMSLPLTNLHVMMRTRDMTSGLRARTQTEEMRPGPAKVTS